MGGITVSRGLFLLKPPETAEEGWQSHSPSGGPRPSTPTARKYKGKVYKRRRDIKGVGVLGKSYKNKEREDETATTIGFLASKLCGSDPISLGYQQILSGRKYEQNKIAQDQKKCIKQMN